MEVALRDAWYVLAVLATHGFKRRTNHWVSERSGIRRVGRVELGHGSSWVWLSYCSWSLGSVRVGLGLVSFLYSGFGRLGPQEVLLGWF